MSNAMREKAEEMSTGLNNYLNGMLRLVVGLKSDGMRIEGGRCVSVCNEELHFLMR